MELLPTIIVFIIVALVLFGIFSLISFIYFRIRHKKSYLTEEFSPNDNVDGPYMEMVPLNTDKTKDSLFIEQSTIRNPLKSLNLSNIRNSKITSLSFEIPQFNIDKTLQTTVSDIPEPQQKYKYVIRLVNYSKEGLEVYTNEVSYVRANKVFKHLKWETEFSSDSVIQHHFYPQSEGNLSDLLDIFKLQAGQFKRVKFTVQAIIKCCESDRNYYLDSLPKFQKVQTISQSEYSQLVRNFQKS